MLRAGPREAAGVVAAYDVQRRVVRRRTRRENHRHQRLPLRLLVVRRLRRHLWNKYVYIPLCLHFLYVYELNVRQIIKPCQTVSRNAHLLRGLEEHQRRGVGPAGDGRHEGRVAARVLRRQQRLEVRPEDGAVADALEGGEGRRAAVVLALCGGCSGGGSRVLLSLRTEIM